MKRLIILVIDGRQSSREYIKSLLKADCDVPLFADAESALRFLSHHQADMILLDYENSGMDGGNFLTQLKAQACPHAADTPVIILSEGNDAERESAMLENGAADYIHKPIHENILKQRVYRVLNLYAGRLQFEKRYQAQSSEWENRFAYLKKRHDIFIKMLALVSEQRDNSTGIHVEHIAMLTRLFTKEILSRSRPGYRLSPEETEYIDLASVLHDLGNVGIPEHILQKPSKLTASEYETVKTHPEIGVRLLDLYMKELRGDLLYVTARDIVLSHHEKWNGDGYPHRLKGENIPLPARILALADSYDAIRSMRPYKAPYTHEQAAKIIVQESGVSFDPVLVEIFIKKGKDFAAL